MGTSRYAFLGRVAPATTAVLIERIPGVRDVRVEVAVADLEKAMAARGSARVGTVRSGAAHPVTQGLPKFDGWNGPGNAGEGRVSYLRYVDGSAGEGEV
jgi:hypothetical protein